VVPDELPPSPPQPAKEEAKKNTAAKNENDLKFLPDINPPARDPGLNQEADF
jgi:hypothetical protein